MIASIAAEGQKTRAAPFGHALCRLAEQRADAGMDDLAVAHHHPAGGAAAHHGQLGGAAPLAEQAQDVEHVEILDLPLDTHRACHPSPPLKVR
jgi:hypothetical protein